MKLSQLQNNESGIITKVKGRGAFRKRIIEMGFVKGQKVIVIKNAPLKNPIEYNIMGYDISLRRSEASLIEVITKEEAEKNTPSKFEGVINDFKLKTSAKAKGKEIEIALVGNPNCGKTTIFNHASKSKEHVGNYSGVTVNSKIARFQQNNYNIKITDLPGTYSLSAYSPEELYVRKHILGELPDVVVNIVDASNLERNLYLTTQLIDMDIKVVIALNMYDDLKKKGDTFDYEALGKMIGIPIIPTVGSTGYGIKDLFNKVIDVYEDKDPTVRHIHINYGRDIEKSIHTIQDEIWENKRLTDIISSRFYSIKLLEKDKSVKFSISKWGNSDDILNTATKEISKIETHFSDDSETVITDNKYGFIAGALKETYKGNVNIKRKNTDKIDNFLTHKYLGFPIFFFFMWLMFQSTFSIGKYPMEWITNFVEYISNTLYNTMASGPLKDMLIDGIIGGVGGVIVFLPNILILFFFISLMEDTGYMARAAFIMDRIMHKIGLHGKSFIPLLMGFGCNVPAIMSTRTIENRDNRLLTILINPFMSCSARLPVYLVIISAFFPNHPGTLLFGIYAFGIIVAAIVAIIFKKTLFKSKEIPFVMELPQYRVPTMRSTLRHMWHKGSQYLQKMGGIILIASIIVWALGYYPLKTENTKKYETEIQQTNKNFDKQIALSNISEKENLLNKKTIEVNKLKNEKRSDHHENSYIGRLGKFIEPVMRPLGFDWKMSVSILSGVAAKEIVVSTMSVLYQTNSVAENNNSHTLMEKLQSAKYDYPPNTGQKVYTPIVALGFLLFILLYFPCVATIAAIKNETGHWKWALFAMFYTSGLAWIVAFIINKIGPFIF
ncbi:MAG: ferrous iron transport protein B [Bacteroidales bacterium]|jgi:ferrous iron transport protein B|nr:ferrous iron transport protein B [Bacteroidales bacterium]